MDTDDELDLINQRLDRIEDRLDNISAETGTSGFFQNTYVYLKSVILVIAILFLALPAYWFIRLIW